ncbi:MAG: hypothetical protein ACOC4E_02600 [Patescibacteria group bacterium]
MSFEQPAKGSASEALLHGFSIRETAESVPERREFSLSRDGWGLRAVVETADPSHITVAVEHEPPDVAIAESNKVRQAAIESFHDYVERHYGFWSQSQAERDAEANAIAAERGDDLADATT